MNIIDHFALIAERSKLLEKYVKDEISKEKFNSEMNRINDLLTGTP